MPMLLAHHEWSLPLLWALIGGGVGVAAAWIKSKFFGHQHEHNDGTRHSHPHDHSHEDHEH